MVIKIKLTSKENSELSSSVFIKVAMKLSISRSYLPANDWVFEWSSSSLSQMKILLIAALSFVLCTSDRYLFQLETNVIVRSVNNCVFANLIW